MTSRAPKVPPMLGAASAAQSRAQRHKQCQDVLPSSGRRCRDSTGFYCALCQPARLLLGPMIINILLFLFFATSYILWSFQNKIHLGSPLGANMAPFWLIKSSRILPNKNPKMHQFVDRVWHRFLIDFWTFFEVGLVPCLSLYHFYRSKIAPLIC